MRHLRRQAEARDAADPLAPFRARFLRPDRDVVYLDGNSLGPPSGEVLDAVLATIRRDWRTRLVEAWSEWIDLPLRAGGLLAPLLGADPAEVALADQTTVNLYKLATAALEVTDGRDVVTDADNFPSDRYVLDAAARRAGGRLRIVPADPSPDDVAAALDGEVGLVSLSWVSYRSGALADAAAITAAAHDVGALVLWDCSHAAGVVPVDLDGIGADLAVGCTYKYLNGGPGAPAFLYVRADLHERLVSPIPGWWGHASMFSFAPDYVPAPDIRRFLVGTPPILSLVAAIAGIELVAEAGIEAIRRKSMAMTGWFVELVETHLGDLGARVVGPRDPSRRGSHVAVAHPEAWQLTQALRDEGVIVDFRTPELVRFGFSPLVNSFADLARAIETTESILRDGRHRRHPRQPTTVT